MVCLTDNPGDITGHVLLSHAGQVTILPDRPYAFRIAGGGDDNRTVDVQVRSEMVMVEWIMALRQNIGVLEWVEMHRR